MDISRVLLRVTPFRAQITLLITYLLSPPASSSEVRVKGLGFSGSCGIWELLRVSDREHPRCLPAANHPEP